MSGSGTLSDAMRAAIESRLATLHTALPGKVVEYDPAKQKASVQPVIKKRYRDDTIESFPVIESVPVVFPRSGGGSLTFPVTPGDIVLLVFAERSLDKWLELGGEQEPNDFGKFQLSDAIAIPGLFPFSDESLDPAGENVTLVFNEAKVVLNPDGKIAIGNSTQELLALFDKLLTILQATTVATAIGPQPFINLADYTSLQGDLAELKGSL